MKNLATAIGIAALTASSLSFAMPADKGDRQGPPRGHHMAQLLDEVGATDTQKANIKEIFKDQREEAKDLKKALRKAHRNLRKLDPAADNFTEQAHAIASEIGRLTSERIAHKAETRRQVALQLTADQREELKELREDMREERRDHKHRKGHR